MKVAFAGTPEFASVALARLHAAGFAVPLVLTQPDRPAGRGMKLQASPVKQFALDHGIAVAQPRSLRLDGKYPQDAQEARAALEAADADLLVVAAYGLILPQWVLDGTPGRREAGASWLGCLNIHASLLPRWRGAAPIHRAIEAGDEQTGVTIMQMDAGLDTGDMLLMEKLPIDPHDTTGTLHDKLAVMGGRLLLEALGLAACGGLKPTPQPEAGITYAHKIEKHEAAIDWSLPAETIERRIRAFDPFPGAGTVANGAPLKVWAASLEGAGGLSPHASEGLAPAEAGTLSLGAGRILSIDGSGIVVQCGTGALRLTELQRPGGKRLPAADFLRGFPLTVGETLGGPAAA
ncbi:methionyl-tRNA formyltransferase [Ottowia thiooxydans]|uniref:methionyl-tRNA formyltransferase n=1 Tax=Ottowia thiooxydans TaxID=219182 RepID=UPI000490C99A|nr:methionyl-tRNA formyltransferase [Ottowia thiooxydans]